MSIKKKIEDEFLNVPLRPNTIPYYTARTAILASISDAATSFKGRVLDIGCGFMPYKGLIESNPDVVEYTGLDLDHSDPYSAVKPDLTWNGSGIPLDDESVDCVVATEFLEHVAEPGEILIEILRVMRPGGKIFATVPFIWNLHEIPSDECRYTPYSLRRHFENAGFNNIEIQGLGGWNLSLAQMIGLWLTFSDISVLQRKILKRAFFPFYVWLIKTDKRPVEFDDRSNSMFTGLSVTAEK